MNLRSLAERRPAWLGPLVAVVVVYGVFAALSPAMLLPGVLLTMAQQTVVVSLCALGMTMIIVTGGIDLSVGSLVALTTVIIARALSAGHGLAISILLALAVATSVGAVIGLLVGRFKMMAFVVTLGAMSVLRGTAKGLASEQKIECNVQGLDALLSADPAAPGLWIAVALAVVVALLLGYTRFGRHVFAVGSNEAAARLCGIDTGRVKIAVYALSGLLVGVAGVMQLSKLNVGDPTDSIGLELDVIAAVVIGGASLSGGEGNVFGSVLGALLMSVIKMGAVNRGMPNWTQEIATGLIIVFAHVLDRVRHRRSARSIV